MCLKPAGPSDRNEYIAWCREGVQALREFLVQDGMVSSLFIAHGPIRAAVYCNYAPPEEAKESTFTSNLARLQALKKKLDPEGLFIGYLDKVRLDISAFQSSENCRSRILFTLNKQ